MNIVLFGAGNIGKMVMQELKKGTVKYFLDNYKMGETLDNVPIISFDQYANEITNDVVIITSMLNNAIKIAAQMEQRAFYNFFYWKELFNEYDKYKDEIEAFRSKCSNSVFNSDLAKAVMDLLRYPRTSCPDSQVEFYYVDFFEFSHYFPIYNELNNRGIKVAMVTEPAIFNTKATFNYEDTVELLDTHEIPHYNLANSNAPVAITTQFVHNLDHYHGKKCHIAYGVSMTKGKSFIFEKANCDGFNLIMVNGNFYKRNICENGFEGRIEIVSYPRYQDYFETSHDKNDILGRLGIKTEKQILIYLPTYDDKNSIQKYAHKINELRAKYYIVTKPHHCTWYRQDKKDDLRTLYEISDLVVDALSPLSDLAVIGDVSICDARSGVMNEISFLNPEIKKVALLNEEKLDDFYFDLTKFVDVVYSPEELYDHITKLEQEDPFIEVRKTYTKDFYDNDVSDGIKRAADAIISLL